MRKFARAAVIAAAVLSAAPAFALFPQQGMWTIGSEVDGKPGRGIQIDRQSGLFMIVTYLGYRPDGSATFMQATGKLEGGKTFVGELTEYKNGRALGGPAQSGEVAQIVGPVSIDFDSSTTGTISLPGEAPQRFSRYQYEDLIKQINRRFSTVIWNRLTPIPVQVSISASGSQFSMVETYLPSSSSNPDRQVRCEYRGDLRPTGDSFASTGKVSCDGTPPGYPGGEGEGGSPEDYRLTELKVDEYGALNARLYLGGRGSTFGWPRYYSGACLSSTGLVLGSVGRCTPDEFGFDIGDSIE